MKTFVVGDIHGGYRALKQVIERAPIDKNKDKLIFLGDYVDGWNESFEVVDYLLELQSRFKESIIFLRGNHDVYVEGWLTTGVKDYNWFSNGGETTFDSYMKNGGNTQMKHTMFFYKLHNYYIDEENRAFVHGGFFSEKGLGNDTPDIYHWDRDMWDLALMLNSRDNTTARFYKHKEVYVGHTATNNWNIKPKCIEYKDERQPNNGGIIIPMNRCNVWNIDTGGGYGGKLTIMDIDTKEFWQSDLLKKLYGKR